MKPTAQILGLWLLLLTATVRAEDAPATQPTPAALAPLSRPEMEKLLSAARPQFSPPPEVKPAAEADPDVLELPKMTVKQRPRPRLGQSDILGPKAFNEELAKKNLGALDRGLLNKFTLPAWLGGVSAAERAREEYNLAQKRQFLSDVSTIAKAAEQTDPANAKALREAAAKP